MMRTRKRATIGQVGPHPVDVHVGSRLRTARVQAGYSRQWLSEQVRLTFQQLQKYERGANRISCSILSEFAAVLNRPVEWFFAGCDEQKPVADLPTDGRQRLVYELTSNFSQITNEKAREQIVSLVRAIADADPRKSDDNPES